jgi:hypothetical protein
VIVFAEVRLLWACPEAIRIVGAAGTCSFALLPGKAYPIIVFDGQAGAAKTSAARIVRNTLDPNEVPVMGMPRGQDLVSCAKNNAVVVFDNLSVLPAAVQDELCRLATGM